MKYLLPLLLFTSSLFAQESCDDFLSIMGQLDNSQTVMDFQKNYGPFEEKVSSDRKTKTWISKEKGMEITFTNDGKSESAEFVLTVILLESSTSKGGFTGQLPFGLEKEMDAHAISKHIKKRKDMEYTNRELGISRSYFTYTGKINEVTEGKKIKIYLEQYRGTGITSMRLTLR